MREEGVGGFLFPDTDANGPQTPSLSKGLRASGM